MAFNLIFCSEKSYADTLVLIDSYRLLLTTFYSEIDN